MKKIVFGIIGAGWRTEFYLRIAQVLPEVFEVAGLVNSQPVKRAALGARWGIRTFASLDEMLGATSPVFVVVSVSWEACPGLIRDLAARSVPVLSETPPAPDLEALIELNQSLGGKARVQVAEQYQFQPLIAAQIALVRSGRLGEIHHAQVSVAHGYHGMNVLRNFLGLGFDEVEISARRITSRIVAGPDRNGWPTEEKLIESEQDLAFLQGGKKSGVFDFTGDQYFSWARSNRVLVRGDRGELSNLELKYLKDFRTPVQAALRRVNNGEGGNLEGHHLRGYLLGEEWIYSNPFLPLEPGIGQLSDDEIAVATCLTKMGTYLDTGVEFSSLAEASQDHYLNLSLQESIRTGLPVVAVKQPWAV
jgi:hypothetical protein